MNRVLIGFWTTMVFASIAWYAYLLFHVGIKGGWDILRLARALGGQKDERDPGGPAPGS